MAIALSNDLDIVVKLMALKYMTTASGGKRKENDSRCSVLLFDRNDSHSTGISIGSSRSERIGVWKSLGINPRLFLSSNIAARIWIAPPTLLARRAIGFPSQSLKNKVRIHCKKEVET